MWAHALNVHVSEPHTCGVIVGESHTRTITLSAHTRNVNMSEPCTYSTTVSESHGSNSNMNMSVP